MEIYNEDINDLLAPENRKLQVHENLEVGFLAQLWTSVWDNWPSQETYIFLAWFAERNICCRFKRGDSKQSRSGFWTSWIWRRCFYELVVFEVVFKLISSALKFLSLCSAHRHVGQTNMNVYSSRSHTIFRMVNINHNKNFSSLLSTIMLRKPRKGFLGANGILHHLISDYCR